MDVEIYGTNSVGEKVGWFGTLLYDGSVKVDEPAPGDDLQ
jgi:hypothetical protein